ncbi:WhiB family transcriptional regulator [Rhodococcus hoagii]|nr:WhiB family transcriptional regulator [Prescottella equi]NKS71726.1 WhiB family transcriptional regulator [Prescottella equi]
MAEGVCSQTDPDAFYPDKGESSTPAQKICTGCPVRTECLEYALERDERYGVWGGLTPRGRKSLLRTRARDVAEAFNDDVSSDFSRVA